MIKIFLIENKFILIGISFDIIGKSDLMKTYFIEYKFTLIE